MDGASEMIVSTRSALIGVDTAPVSLLYVMDRPLLISLVASVSPSLLSVLLKPVIISEDVSAA